METWIKPVVPWWFNFDPQPNVCNMSHHAEVPGIAAACAAAPKPFAAGAAAGAGLDGQKHVQESTCNYGKGNRHQNLTVHGLALKRKQCGNNTRNRLFVSSLWIHYYQCDCLHICLLYLI